MRRIIHVRIFRGDEYYVAESSDIPLITQGATLDELTQNLTEAIGLALEGEDLAELGFTEHPTIVATMEIDTPPVHAKA